MDIYSPAGVDITATPTSPQFKVGQCAVGADNTEWVYVQASGVITQYDYVAVDEDFTARAGTVALLGAGHSIAFAQSAFADNDYGWVAKKGTNINVRVASGASSDAALYTTGTAGVLDAGSNTSGNLEVLGLASVASNATGVAGVEVIATFPHVNLA